MGVMQFVCTILSKVKILVTLPLLGNHIPFEQMHRRAQCCVWWEEEEQRRFEICLNASAACDQTERGYGGCPPIFSALGF